MPKMNGYELVEKIREWESKMDTDHIPIFALTADASTRNRKKCFESGFDDFLIKPYTKATFRYLIDRLSRINS
jgi:CheY-like chemotaxis protein